MQYRGITPIILTLVALITFILVYYGVSFQTISIVNLIVLGCMYYVFVYSVSATQQQQKQQQLKPVIATTSPKKKCNKKKVSFNPVVEYYDAGGSKKDRYNPELHETVMRNSMLARKVGGIKKLVAASAAES